MAVRARVVPDETEVLDREDRLTGREERVAADVLEDERGTEFFINPVWPDLLKLDSWDRDFPVFRCV
jgi:hypothetical protein